MNFKKTFNKIIAIILCFTIFGYFVPRCYATCPPQLKEIVEPSDLEEENLLSEDSKIAKKIKGIDTESYLSEQINIFKRLGEGHFDVPKETIDNLHPLVLAISLNFVNDFFSKYDNIKKEFINMVTLKGETPFTITCPTIEPIKKLYYDPTKNAMMSYFFLTQEGYMYGLEDVPELQLNRTYYGKDNNINKIINFNQKLISNKIHPEVTRNIYNIIGSVVVHELGHVCQAVQAHKNFSLKYLTSEERKKEFEEYVKDLAALHKRYFGEYSFDFWLLTKKSFYLDYEWEWREAAEALNKTIIGYAGGMDYISEYGKSSHFEFFPEALSHGMCHSKPNRLGVSAVEQLKKLNDECA